MKNETCAAKALVLKFGIRVSEYEMREEEDGEPGAIISYLGLHKPIGVQLVCCALTTAFLQATSTCPKALVKTLRRLPQSAQS
jgi:hypothetical protein